MEKKNVQRGAKQRTRKIVAWVMLLTFICTNQFTMSSVWGEDGGHFLTGVRLEDGQGHDVANSEVALDAALSIVYSFETAGIAQTISSEAPQNSGETVDDSMINDEPAADNAITNDKPTVDNNMMNNEFTIDEGIINNESHAGNSGGNGVINPVFVVQIPQEFDLIATSPEIEVMDENGSIVGNGTVDPANKTATITLTTTEMVKGEFRVAATLNSQAVQVGRQKITFAFGNGANTAITMKVIAPKMSRNADEVLSFATKVKLFKVSTKDLEVLGKDVNMDEGVRVEYTYVIPNDATGDKAIKPETKYTFELPKEIKIKDVEEKSFQIIDKSSSDFVVANGIVTAADNKAYIEFTAEAKDGGYLEPEATGSFYIEADFNSAEIKNEGKQELDFTWTGSAAIPPVEVDFAMKQIEAKVILTKEGQADLAAGKITWTVTATPSMTNANGQEKHLDELVITDNISDHNLTYVDDGNMNDIGTRTTIEDQDGRAPTGEFAFDESTKTLIFTFADGFPVEEAAVYTMRFETTFSLNAWQNGNDEQKFTNRVTANFAYPQYEKGSDDRVVVATDTKAGVAEEASQTIAVAGDFLKKSGVLASGAQEINWTLAINQKGLPVNNATIVDAITVDNNAPAGITIEKVMLYDATTATGTGVDITIDDTKCKIEGNKLTITLGNITSAKCVTYTSKVDQSYWEKNDPTIFKNKAVFTGGEIGQGLEVSKTADVEIGKHMITKGVQNVDVKNHMITWTIGVNTKSMALNDAVVVDPIPAGLTYVEGSVTSGATYEARYHDAEGETHDNAIVMQYGEITGPQTITFKTTIDDPKYWAVNYKGKTVENTAYLVSALPRASASYTPTINSAVLAKSAGNYDVTTKETDWTLTVNQNQMKMTNPQIVDTVPEGEEFVEGIFDPQNVVESYSYDTVHRTVTMMLKDLPEGGAAPKISYRTKLVDLSKLGTDTSFKMTNKATLTCTEMGNLEQSVEQSKVVSKSIVRKTGVQINQGVAGAKFDTIKWTVMINENLMPIDQPVLTDQLPEGLTLQEDSVALYKLTLDATGAVTNTEEAAVNPENISYQDNVLRFIVDEEIKDAYKLEFKTYFDVAQVYTNSIAFAGMGTELVGSSNAVNAAWSGAGGSAGGAPKKDGKITVITADDEGQPVVGAVFKIGQGQIATTDAQGKAELTDLLLDGKSTMLTEISVPEQYLVDGTTRSVTPTSGEGTMVSVTNIKVKGSMQIKIVESNNLLGDALQGAALALYQQQVDGTANLIEERTDINNDGQFLFEDLPYGHYLVKETVAPKGYVLSTVPLSFTVDREHHGQTQVKILANQRRSYHGDDPVIEGGGSTSGGGVSGSGTNTPGGTPTAPVVPITPIILAAPVAISEPIFEDQMKRIEEKMTVTKTQKEGVLQVAAGSTPTITATPSHGTVSIDDNGKWVYTPNPGFHGRDSFTVTIVHPDGTIEEIIVDVDVPLGTMNVDQAVDGETLPYTGEASHTPFYLGGAALILLGLGLRRKMGSHQD